MNDHDLDVSLISAYADGELDATETAQVEQLLKTSAAARAELESYRKMSTLLQDAARVTVTANLAADVLRSIQAGGFTKGPRTAEPVSIPVPATSVVRPTQSPTWKGRRLFTALATAAACVVAVVWINVNAGRGPQQVAGNTSPTVGPVTPEVTPAGVQGVSTQIAQNGDAPSTASMVDAAVTTPTVTTPMEKALPATVQAATQKPSKPLEASQLPIELIADLKNSNIGQIQRFIRQNKEGVTVFHLMVVDMQPGLDSLQMILSAEEISAMDGKPVNQRPDVVAVYVQARQDKMESLVQQIQKDHDRFLALGMQQGAVPVDQVASITAKKTSEESQAIPVVAADLQNVGVAPLQSQQIADARNSRGSRSSRPPSTGMANRMQNAIGTAKANENPMLKLLILVEKVNPELLQSN